MKNLALNDTATIEKIAKSMLFHSGEPFTTSLQIAKYFGIGHNDLLKKIRAFHSFENLIKLGKITQLKRVYRNQEFPYFELDADAFSFTCLSLTGKKAESFKWSFIQAFKKATVEAIGAKVAMQQNKANSEWIEARSESKHTRKYLTYKIKEFTKYAESQRGYSYNGKSPYYKIVTDAIYSFFDIEAPKAGQAPRDTLSGGMVETIETAESVVTGMLDDIIYNKQSRKNLKERIIKELDSVFYRNIKA